MSNEEKLRNGVEELKQVLDAVVGKDSDDIVLGLSRARQIVNKLAEEVPATKPQTFRAAKDA